MEELSVGILVVSDTAFKDSSTDRATREISDVFAATTQNNNVKWVIQAQQIIPDKLEYIQKVLKEWADDKKLHLAVLSGGTGFAVNDITPEACIC
jgi:gephyrin